MSLTNTFYSSGFMGKTASEYASDLHDLQQAKDNLQKDYQEAVDKVNELLLENIQLQQRLDKAIEYIKDYIEYYGLHIQNDEMEKSYYKRLEELLEILGDKDE